MPVADLSPTFTVGELTDAINAQLKSGFGGGVWVTGEISGYRDQGQHSYFSLVEDIDGKKATVNVALFANVKRNLRPMLASNRLELSDGTKVRVFGTLDVYAPTGRLSLKISDLDPRFTLGDITASRDRVLASLTAEGLLRNNAMHSVSIVPLRVAVVTSVGSAAWHDFTDELESSGFGFHLLAFDARVQGDQAEAMVIAGIAAAVDRGGGARNDLAAFDTEGVARAIATCPLPVITGLGHEIDTTVADEVAHTALKTPTACAGWLIDRVQRFVDETEARWGVIVERAFFELATQIDRLESRASRVVTRTNSAIERSAERLRSRQDRLVRTPLTIERVDTSITERERRLALLDPARLLERGWTMTTTADGRIVTSARDLSVGDELITRLVDGVVRSTVNETTPEEE
jgi:exodeoxyribonuclease VII large subunit